jgi:archaellin
MQECPTCGSSHPSATDVCAHCGTTLDGGSGQADSGQPNSNNQNRQRRQPAQQPERNQPQQGRQGQRPQQPQQGQPPQGRPPQGGGPSRGPHGPGGDDGFSRREMLVGGVGIAGLAGGGWVLLGDGNLPLVGGSDDKTAGPERVMQAYVEALDTGDAAALQSLLHAESPWDEIDDDALSNVQQLELTFESATVIDEELSVNPSEYETVQAFEVVKLTLTQGEQQSGETEPSTQRFVVAKNQNGEWKLWTEPTGVTNRTQETDTGSTESTEQVANSLDVITEVGSVGPDNSIVELRLGVKPAAGADESDLSQLALQYVSDDASANLVVGDDQSTGERATGETNPEDLVVGDREENDERYGLRAVSAADETNLLMTEKDDRYEILVPLGTGIGVDLLSDGETNGTLEPLPKGRTAEIIVTTESGAQMVSFMEVPEPLEEEPGVTVDL